MNVAGAAFSPPKKHSAKHFSVEDKTGILNIFKAYSEDNPEVSKTDKVEFTAKAAGVSIPSVYKILREYTEVHELHSPNKYYRPRAILDNIDSGTKSILRRLLHSFFERNEPPTLSKVLAVLHEDEDLPHLKRTTLWKLIL
ncbi:uncharacterized protein LOC116176364 [Photinus pyralis]|uniref:uncharacterized protein LOC116174336 n=1 Tax=Photinus pyralis TaxID=7054 RepID=UPI0012674724|nr:uncharacterized protein LOC116174336 [Photinus pyralis]XP_031350751.1 uncharacterized protein LOC116176364 [Photinus pyralis]